MVESFQEVLESSQVLAKAKTQVATDEEAARACAERAAAVKEKIADGKDADIVLLDAENDIADVFVGGNLIER